MSSDEETPLTVQPDTEKMETSEVKDLENDGIAAGVVESDSDDEPVFLIKRKKNVNKSVLDSDAESENEESDKENNPSAAPPNTAVESSDEENSDAEETPTRKKKKVQRALLQSDSEDETVKKSDSDKSGDEGNDGESDTEEVSTKGSQAEKSEKIFRYNNILSNTDIFDQDSGSDSEREAANSDEEGNQNSGVENSEGEQEADDDAPVEMSAALKKRLAKGAAKKPSKSGGDSVKKSKRAEKNELQELHSESQRMLRESTVRVPYYEPPKLGLSVFLARTKLKQEALLGVKNPKLEVKCANSPLLDIKPKNSPLPDLKAANSPLMSRLEKKMDLQKDSPADIAVKGCIDLSDDSGIQKTTVELSEKSHNELKNDMEISEKCSQNVDTDPLGEDELPDLFIESDKSKSVDSANADDICAHEIVSAKDLKSCDPTITVTDLSDKVESSVNSSENVECTNLEKDEMDRLKVVDSKKPERDSGYLTTPIHSSEEENSGDACHKIDSEDKNEKDSDVPKDTLLLELQNKSETKSSQFEGLGVPNIRPRLSGGPNDFIDLDDDEEDDVPKKKTEVENLIERMMKHSKTKRKKKPKQVELSTVSKAEDNKELKLEKFTYTIDDDADIEDTDKEVAPGARHVKLKEKLAECISKKRAESRKQREELMAEYNEDAYEETGVLDEEGELTDQTDTDAEEDDGEFDEEEEVMEAEDGAQEEKEDNPFLDDQAEESDEDDGDEIEEEDLQLALDDDTERQGDDNEEDSVTCKDDESNASFMKDKIETSMHSGDISLDTSSSQLQLGQCTGKKYKQAGRELTTPEPCSNSMTAKSKSIGKFSSLQMPIEDSQDLLNLNYISQSKNGESTPVQESQNFHFFLDATQQQSQMLDDDGLFKEKESDADRKQSIRRQLMLNEDAMSGDASGMKDLLGLCSGNFSEGTQKPTGFGLGVDKKNDDNVDELLNLCSGQFTGVNQQTQAPKALSTGMGKGISGLFNNKIADEDENSVDDSPVKQKKLKVRKPMIEEDSNDSFTVTGADSKDDDGNDTDILASDEEESETEEVEDPKFTGFVDKRKGKIRADFVEAEAELSGSEYDSDENLDLDERDDIMEEESGDEDLKDVDQEELRNQVHRVHLKSVIDEDKKQIRLMQEMYLQDGDLYSEGAGRARKFKWKHVDDDTQQDLFNTSDTEEAKEAEEEEEEMKWRKERFEREKFLKEQSAEESAADEDSQLLKLGKQVFKSKPVISQESSAKPAATKTTTASSQQQQPIPIFKKPKPMSGSFLKRGKDTLAKMVEMTKPISNVNGPRHSKNFVFQHVTAEQKENQEKRANMKRSMSSQPSPSAKKARLEKSNSLPKDSIFNML